MELSSQLNEHKGNKKHKMDKVALYKMCLVRIGFLDRSDKASLKITVEELYKETGQGQGPTLKF